MARADLLISLVKAATSGDRAMVNKTVEAMVAEERAKKHSVLAEQLEKQVHRNGFAPKADYVPARTSAHDVVHELSPKLTLGDLILVVDPISWTKKHPFLRWWAALKMMQESQCLKYVRVTHPA